MSILDRPILSWTSIFWRGKFRTLLRRVFLTLSDFKILSKKRRRLKDYLKMLDSDKFVQNFNSNKIRLPRKLISWYISRLSLQQTTDVLFKWTVYNTREITKAHLLQFPEHRFLWIVAEIFHRIGTFKIVLTVRLLSFFVYILNLYFWITPSLDLGLQQATDH